LQLRRKIFVAMRRVFASSGNKRGTTDGKFRVEREMGLDVVHGSGVEKGSGTAGKEQGQRSGG
jgi:hypothetical protein